MGEGLALARSKIARFFFEVGRSVVFAAGVVTVYNSSLRARFA